MENESDIEKGKGDEIDSIHLECGTIEEWKSTFVAKLCSNSPMPESCCIFRVPEVLRRQKIVAYQPDIVSIGPYHRGGEQFQLIENVKKWYLSCLLSRPNIHLDSLMVSIAKMETDARNCYAGPLNLDQKDFVEMLILDGCFLIELFRKILSNKQQDADDPIFNVACLRENIYHDLLLLENQMPWFVLEILYNLIENSSNEIKPPLNQVVIAFFSKILVADADHISNYHKPDSSPPILHILDLIRSALVEKDQNPPIKQTDSSSSVKDQTTDHLPQRIPSAATLSEAGVTFRKGTPGSILNIEFDDGVFTIPPLGIDEMTSPLFRNLIAYEQCYYGCWHKITSYAVLMDNLIDTSKDVDLLCNKGIVSNWLSAEEASKFFNELYTDTTVVGFEYMGLYDQVHEYYNNIWNKWREKLKRDYFDTPWSTISFFAAFVLLVLTFLQTIYTIKPS